MSTKLVIRLARPREAGAIALMSRELIERGFSWRWTPGRIAAQMADPDCTVIVGTEQRRIVGFAAMSFGFRFAHLNLLAVRRDCRKRGVGSALLKWLERSARTAGVMAIRLEVRARNRAGLEFYRAHAYEEVARIRGYYEGREDAIRMLSVLHFPFHRPLELWRPASTIDGGE